MVLKAISFALVGVVNTLIDAALFFLAFRVLSGSQAGQDAATFIVGLCHCSTPATVTLIAANTFSWYVAVSGSYVMNSIITFAAESGRRLRLAAYGMFVMSGILGYLANTTTLVVAAHFLPVWAAKGCAILASFVVNFSMSHFVVFRPGRPKTERAG